MMRSSFWLLALATAACGDLVDSEYESTPLATFRGTLNVSSGLQINPGQDLKVAIVWEAPQEQAGRFNEGGVGSIYPPLDNTPTCTEEAIEGQYACSADPYEAVGTCLFERGPKDTLTDVTDLNPEFPLDFSLTLNSPPPIEALYDLADQGGSGSFAMGNVIVFEDRDGDDQFDWGRVGVAPERIIGLSSHINQLTAPGESVVYFRIAYLDGTFHPTNALNDEIRSAAQATPQGFSVWEQTVNFGESGVTIPVRRAVFDIEREMELFAFPEIEKTTNGCETWRVATTFTRDEVVHPEGSPEPQCVLNTEVSFYPKAQLHEKWIAPCEYDWGRVQRFCVSLLESFPADWPCECGCP